MTGKAPGVGKVVAKDVEGNVLGEYEVTDPNNLTFTFDNLPESAKHDIKFGDNIKLYFLEEHKQYSEPFNAKVAKNPPVLTPTVDDNSTLSSTTDVVLGFESTGKISFGANAKLILTDVENSTNKVTVDLDDSILVHGANKTTFNVSIAKLESGTNYRAEFSDGAIHDIYDQNVVLTIPADTDDNEGDGYDVKTPMEKWDTVRNVVIDGVDLSPVADRCPEKVFVKFEAPIDSRVVPTIKYFDAATGTIKELDYKSAMGVSYIDVKRSPSDQGDFKEVSIEFNLEGAAVGSYFASNEEGNPTQVTFKVIDSDIKGMPRKNDSDPFVATAPDLPNGKFNEPFDDNDGGHLNDVTPDALVPEAPKDNSKIVRDDFVSSHVIKFKQDCELVVNESKVEDTDLIVVTNHRDEVVATYDMAKADDRAKVHIAKENGEWVTKLDVQNEADSFADGAMYTVSFKGSPLVDLMGNASYIDSGDDKYNFQIGDLQKLEIIRYETSDGGSKVLDVASGGKELFVNSKNEFFNVVGVVYDDDHQFLANVRNDPDMFKVNLWAKGKTEVFKDYNASQLEFTREGDLVWWKLSIKDGDPWKNNGEQDGKYYAKATYELSKTETYEDAHDEFNVDTVIGSFKDRLIDYQRVYYKPVTETTEPLGFGGIDTKGSYLVVPKNDVSGIETTTIVEQTEAEPKNGNSQPASVDYFGLKKHTTYPGSTDPTKGYQTEYDLVMKDLASEANNPDTAGNYKIKLHVTDKAGNEEDFDVRTGLLRTSYHSQFWARLAGKDKNWNPAISSIEDFKENLSIIDYTKENGLDTYSAEKFIGYLDTTKPNKPDSVDNLLYPTKHDDFITLGYFENGQDFKYNPFTVSNGLISGCTVYTDEGDDTIYTIGDVTASWIFMGKGDDYLAFGAKVEGSLVDMGPGNDRVTIRGLREDGTGNNSGVRNSEILLGDGDDVLTTIGVLSDAKIVSGGRGIDYLGWTGFADGYKEDSLEPNSGANKQGGGPSVGFDVKLNFDKLSGFEYIDLNMVANDPFIDINGNPIVNFNEKEHIWTGGFYDRMRGTPHMAIRVGELNANVAREFDVNYDKFVKYADTLEANTNLGYSKDSSVRALVFNGGLDDPYKGQNSVVDLGNNGNSTTTKVITFTNRNGEQETKECKIFYDDSLANINNKYTNAFWYTDGDEVMKGGKTYNIYKMYGNENYPEYTTTGLQYEIWIQNTLTVY